MTTNEFSCLTDDYTESGLTETPEEKLLLEKVQLEISRTSSLTRGEYPDSLQLHKIPVVFHVVYHEDVENIADADILGQIDSLNRDFGNKNIDNILFNEYTREKRCAMDAKIEFIIASKDPDGNSTNGITRTHTERESFVAPEGRSDHVPLEQQPVKSTYLGGKDAWDTRKYLNVWICNLSNASGYAQYPLSPDDMTDTQFRTDGTVINYKCFGSGGTTTPTRNKGRTLPHEIGHWLRLYHPWGPGGDGSGCGLEGDRVFDTVAQKGPQEGRPSGYSRSKQCPGCDPPLVLNFMDQWDDEYSLMFTRGQVAWMRHWLENYRKTIIT